MIPRSFHRDEIVIQGLTAGVDYRVAAPLTVTDRMMERGIWFGVYPGLDDARLRYMIDTIRKFLHDKRTK